MNPHYTQACLDLHPYRFTPPIETPHLLNIHDLAKSLQMRSESLGELASHHKRPDTSGHFATHTQTMITAAAQVEKAWANYITIDTIPRPQETETLRQTGLTAIQSFLNANNQLILNEKRLGYEDDDEILRECLHLKELAINMHAYINAITMPYSELVLYMIDQLGFDGRIRDQLLNPHRFVSPPIIHAPPMTSSAHITLTHPFLYYREFANDQLSDLQDLSHELKNPIISIKGFIHFAITEFESSTEKQIQPFIEELNKLRDNVEQIWATVSNHLSSYYGSPEQIQASQLHQELFSQLQIVCSRFNQYLLPHQNRHISPLPTIEPTPFVHIIRQNILRILIKVDGILNPPIQLSPNLQIWHSRWKQWSAKRSVIFLPAILQDIHHAYPFVRYEALSDLEILGSSKMSDELKPLLHDGNDQVRALAAKFLREWDNANGRETP